MFKLFVFFKCFLHITFASSCIFIPTDSYLLCSFVFLLLQASLGWKRQLGLTIDHTDSVPKAKPLDPFAVQCCVPIGAEGGNGGSGLSSTVLGLLGGLHAINLPNNAGPLELLLASWYRWETEAQKCNDLPRSRRGPTGAGSPAQACPAFSRPPSCPEDGVFSQPQPRSQEVSLHVNGLCCSGQVSSLSWAQSAHL